MEWIYHLIIEPPQYLGWCVLGPRVVLSVAGSVTFHVPWVVWVGPREVWAWRVASRSTSCWGRTVSHSCCRAGSHMPPPGWVPTAPPHLSTRPIISHNAGSYSSADGVCRATSTNIYIFVSNRHREALLSTWLGWNPRSRPTIPKLSAEVMGPSIDMLSADLCQAYVGSPSTSTHGASLGRHIPDVGGLSVDCQSNVSNASADNPTTV
jgi:hypothetical protein